MRSFHLIKITSFKSKEVNYIKKFNNIMTTKVIIFGTIFNIAYAIYIIFEKLLRNFCVYLIFVLSS